VTVGSFNDGRTLLPGSPAFGRGSLLYGIEYQQSDGPWRSPNRFAKYNGVLRYAQGSASDRFNVTAMGYTAEWNATDQIPRRAVDAGLLDRFGTIDPTDGGFASRYSLSGEWRSTGRDTSSALSLYIVKSRLKLYSNFTFFLDNPIAGDQFQQSEKRLTFGGEARQTCTTRLWNRPISNKLGLQIRRDSLDPVALYSTVARERVSTTREDRVTVTSAAPYFSNSIEWTSWFRTVAGLRIPISEPVVRASYALGERTPDERTPTSASRPIARTKSVDGSGTARGSAYRKSSITTTSIPPPSLFAPLSGALPVVMRTRPIRSPALKITPRNEKLAVPGAAGAKKVPSDAPNGSKNCIDVVFAISTSLKTTPKPLTAAGIPPFDPGRKKVASVMLPTPGGPTGVKTRFGLNARNVVAYVGLMSARLFVPLATSDCCRPVPGVVNNPPRVLRKVVKGVTGAVPLVAPPPSQLISRWPVGCGPWFPLSGAPSAIPNAVTVGCKASAVAAVVLVTRGAATLRLDASANAGTTNKRLHSGVITPPRVRAKCLLPSEKYATKILCFHFNHYAIVVCEASSKT
jgi:hypothetical protein